MEEIAGLIVALHAHNTATRSKMTRDHWADGGKPLFNVGVEGFASIGGDGKLMRRMQSPGGIQVKTSYGCTRLHRWIEQHPFREAKIRQFRVNQRPRTYQQPEAAFLT